MKNFDAEFLHDLHGLRSESKKVVCECDRKIIQTLQIIRVKKLMANAVLWNQYLSSYDF